MGLRSFKIKKHLTTRTDDSHAAPVSNIYIYYTFQKNRKVILFTLKRD